MYMTKPVISIDIDFSLNDILRVIKEEKISHLIVIAKGKYQGVISKSDVLDSILKICHMSSGQTYNKLNFESITAKDIMAKKTIVVGKSQSLDYATELLLQGHFHCLPVVENDLVNGIVTPYDLLKGYYQEVG